jgi:TolB-like protein/cytochrome c-type biogenesis protein CcmH/NrfG
MDRLRHLIQELHRRSLWQVLTIYLVASWGVLQVIDTLVDALQLPEWLPPFALTLLLIGLPVVLATAFVQEGGPSRHRWGPVPPPEGDGGSDSRAAVAPVKSRPARRLLNWRNAMVGGVFAFALWGVVATLWLAFGGLPAGGSGSIASVPTVAVLPFINLSGDPAATPFVNGMHDDLITQLSKIGTLEVISRTSVARYADTGKTIPEIAAELGVAWIVEGGVQMAGNRVRLNAQLIDANSDRHLWAENFDRQLTVENIFAIQNDLAGRIASGVEAKLTPETERRLGDVPTRDVEAYELYHAARTSWRSRTKEGTTRATELFARALERDSTFALAWSGLADAWVNMGFYGYAPRDPALVRGAAAAETAVALDPDLAEARASLGQVRLEQLRMQEAEHQLRRAVELNPGYGDAWYWYGLTLWAMGRYDEAEKIVARAIRLDPLNPALRVTASRFLLARQDLETARTILREAVELEPQFAYGHMVLALCAAFAGRPAEAREALERGSALVPIDEEDASARTYRVATLAMLGDTALARELVMTMTDDRRTNGWKGIALSFMVDHDGAFRAWRDVEWWWLPAGLVRLLTPEAVKRDPRFDDVLQRIDQAMGLR